MHRLKRSWNVALGGYTYDGVNLTECQCNTSGGGCKCGKLENDKRRELKRRANIDLNPEGETK